MRQTEEDLRTTRQRFIEGLVLNAEVLDAEVARLEARLRHEFDPVTELTYTVEAPVSVAHVAWQEGKDAAADVFYSYAPYDWCEPDACPWPYHFCFAARQKVSGFVLNSNYVLPPDDPSWWYIEPSWQGQVSLDFVPDLNQYSTYCHANSTTVYSKGVIIAWSDARSYDDWRYEIRTRRAASPEGDPETYEVCEDWAEGTVNSNAKLHALRDDPDRYDTYKPAAASAYNPDILVDEAGIYVAWDDDRWDDPSVKGTLRNRDVFATRMEMAPQGVYISPVLNGRTAAPLWYVLSWWGATQHFGDVLFQTRFGTTPTPPEGDVAANGWTRWTGNPSSTYLGCTKGVGCYYDAPGRHIVRPDGTDWFSNPAGTPYQYMQYKVIIRGYSRLTAVSQVTVHYKGVGGTVYLPLVLRRY